MQMVECLPKSICTHLQDLIFLYWFTALFHKDYSFLWSMYAVTSWSSSQPSITSLWWIMWQSWQATMFIFTQESMWVEFRWVVGIRKKCTWNLLDCVIYHIFLVNYLTLLTAIMLLFTIQQVWADMSSMWPHNMKLMLDDLVLQRFVLFLFLCSFYHLLDEFIICDQKFIWWAKGTNLVLFLGIRCYQHVYWGIKRACRFQVR